MGAISKYLSDEEIINNLRSYFDEYERYNINFHYWLNTARQTDNGILINVMSRKFLITEISGVIEEVA